VPNVAIISKTAVACLPKRSRNGYALLLVVFFVTLLLIAVGVAAPNIIVQGRREKEKEMIWRGKQYVRAIRLYYQKTGRYPSQLEDLYKPKTGIRVMRQAYKDPLNTVDGSWRLIYVAPNGQLIGSLKERRNAFFFGAQPPAKFGAALAPLSVSAGATNNPFSSQPQSSSRLAPATDNFSNSNAPSPSQQNPAINDQTNAVAADSSGTPRAPGSNDAPASSGQFVGTATVKASARAVGGEIAQTGAAPSSDKVAEIQQAPNPGAEQSAESPDSASPSSAAALLPPVQPQSQPPFSTSGTNSQSAAQPPGTQPPDAGPTFGNTIIIGVGSKINKASVMHYDGEKNYLHFEFLWDGLTASSGAPSP
jgi:hypothetical protein